MWVVGLAEVDAEAAFVVGGTLGAGCHVPGPDELAGDDHFAVHEAAVLAVAAVRSGHRSRPFVGSGVCSGSDHARWVGHDGSSCVGRCRVAGVSSCLSSTTATTTKTLLVVSSLWVTIRLAQLVGGKRGGTERQSGRPVGGR